MTRQEIIQLILEDAHTEVQRQGFTFSHEGESYLKRFVTDGVNKNMTLHDCVSDDRIALARRNMREIVVELCAYERSRNHMIVESRTFSNSRFHFCPRFPFC